MGKYSADSPLSSVSRQVEKVFQHAKKNSQSGRAKYRSSCRQFAKFVNEKYKMQNIKNMTEKHIKTFLEHRQATTEPKTWKNDLPALRYMHDRLKLDGIKTKMQHFPSNKTLQDKHGIEFPAGPKLGQNGDRAWTEKEINGAIEYARETGNQHMADMVQLCHTMGYRIAEVALASRTQAMNALKNDKNLYHIGKEAKNGRERDIPLSPAGREILSRLVQETPPGSRIFYNIEEQKSHLFINKCERWLANNKHNFVDKDNQRWHHSGKDVDLTWHGLRYNFTQEKMEERQEQGMSWEQAAEKTMQDLGHNRDKDIFTYLK